MDAHEHLFRMKLRHALHLHGLRLSVSRRDESDIVSDMTDHLTLQMWCVGVRVGGQG